MELMLDLSSIRVELSLFDNTIIDISGWWTYFVKMQLEFPIFNDPDSNGDVQCPGVLIQAELTKRGWSQASLAEVLGRPIAAVNEVIKGKRALTPEMAVALGRAFNQPAELWAHREAAYRLSLVEDAPDDDTARKAHLFESAPIKDMQRRGWINPQLQAAEDLERELEGFFRTDVLAVARQTKSSCHFSNAERAWLCRAAALAERVSTRPYSRDNLISALPKLRNLIALPERAARAPIALAELGVRLVIVQDLPRTPIDGAAFFMCNDPTKPVIVLSLRIDRMESVWHTAGHEIQHIIRSDPLSLDSELVGRDRAVLHDEMERAADEGSANWLIPKAEMDDFVRRAAPFFARERIIQFANRMKIHPAVIVGQLHHRGVIGWDKGNDFCPKVREHFLSTTTKDGYSK
jgi:HTH-type transcriptional regulator / antitoxin HigA